MKLLAMNYSDVVELINQYDVNIKKLINKY